MKYALIIPLIIKIAKAIGCGVRGVHRAIKFYRFAKQAFADKRITEEEASVMVSMWFDMKRPFDEMVEVVIEAREIPF